MSLETAFIMLQSPHPVRQEDAADALWTHAHLNDAMKVAIREAGAIPLLVELLESWRSADARRSAAGALANIAHENAENKVAIREAGAIPPLLALVEFGGAYSRPMSVDAFFEINCCPPKAGDRDGPLNLICLLEDRRLGCPASFIVFPTDRRA